jgi:hypothetical protein
MRRAASWVCLREQKFSFLQILMYHTNNNQGIGSPLPIIESVNGAGDVIPPFVIWSVKEHRNNWIPLTLDKSMDGTVFAISPNGYTDPELSFEWISKVFHSATVQRCRGHTRLLVMDGHSSHLTGELLGFCHDNNILLTCLPAHTTHMLQPLDVGCFGLLAHYYRTEVEEACVNGLDNVSKCDFIRFYAEARQRAFTRENICSSFSESGLIPFNPSVVYEKLISEDKRPETPESSSRSPIKNSRGLCRSSELLPPSGEMH